MNNQEVKEKIPFEKKHPILDKILSYTLYFLITLVVILFVLKMFFFSIYRVNGESMYPTFEDGDLLIAPYVKDDTKLQRDDVVIVNGPDSMIIKRLIGLPGDTIEIKDGKVYVNGKVRENEPNTRFYYQKVERNLKMTLKEDEYFVLGDNRENSADSRNFGPFNREDIKAVYKKPMEKE